jgi:Circadian oscillating protein COP23
MINVLFNSSNLLTIREIIMNRTLISLALTTAIALPMFSSTPPAVSQTKGPAQITFFCKDVYDQASGQKIPATFAWIPERQGNITVVGWKSQFFAKRGWNAQKRCADITPKFQQAFDSGRLQYLTTGASSGYPVVCAIAKQEDACNSTSQLFTLKPHDQPALVLQQLMDVLTGKASDMLLQSSDGKTYVPMQEFFKKAPLADKDTDAPCKVRTAGTDHICKAASKPQ